MCSKENQRSGLYRAAGFSSFSSMSLGSYNRTRASCGPYLGCHITPVSVNETLLAPLDLDIDSTVVQAVRSDEKDQIKGLNDQFASLIDQLRIKEQRNKMLETQWKLLQEQTTASSDSEPMMKAYISNLQRKLDMVSDDRSRLDQENHSMHRSVEDFKKKYEDEIHKRNEAEKDFVILKKEVDAGYLAKVKLENEVTSLVEEINVLRTLYDMELCELKESLKGLSVVVQMDNSRGLNMERIVSEVKAQYEEVAARSRTEAESWYKVKFDQMTSMTDQNNSELSETKGEIVEIQHLISRKEKEILFVKEQRIKLDERISEAEASGTKTATDAEALVKELQQGLQRHRHNMAQQVRHYQELMNVKLALDMEVSTYRKLLEGEEERIGHQSIISISSNNGLYYEPPCTHPGPRSSVLEKQEELLFLWYPSGSISDETRCELVDQLFSNALGPTATKKEPEIVTGCSPDAEYQPSPCESPSGSPVMMTTPESSSSAPVLIETTETQDSSISYTATSVTTESETIVLHIEE